MGIWLSLYLLLLIGFIFVVWFQIRGRRSSPIERIESYVLDTDAVEFERPKTRKTWIQFLGSMIERIPMVIGTFRNIRLELVQADIPLTAEELTALRGCFAFALGFLVMAVTHRWESFPVVFLIVWMVPRYYLKRRIAKRLRAFTDQLGDGLTLLANSLRAGFSFLQAVNSVARELPDPIGKEFGRVTKEMSLGMTIDTAMANFLERVPAEDLELMVTAILIQKEIGGNLAEILDNIGETIRERVRIQGEIRTLTAQGRLSGFIVVMIPLVLTGVLELINPAYIGLLFSNPMGQVMVGVGVTSEILGIVMIRKIIQIEV